MLRFYNRRGSMREISGHAGIYQVTGVIMKLTRVLNQGVR